MTTDRFRTPEWIAQATAVGLCVASLSFVGLLVAAIAIRGEVALFTDPLLLQVALALPYVVLVLTLGTVLGAGWAWWTQALSLAARLHQTVLALLGVAFVWQLFALGFLPA